MLNNKTLITFILLCLSVDAFAGEKLVRPSISTGLEMMEAIKSDLWDRDDTDWARWAVVNIAPTRSHFPVWEKENQQQFMEEFDPDHLGEWAGMAANRGDFFRARGVACNSPMEYEFQEAQDICHRSVELTEKIFGYDNGIAMDEKGNRTYNYGVRMCASAPKWHELVKQGLVRVGVFSDSIFQDLISEGLMFIAPAGFCDGCNKRFIAYMQKGFTPKQLSKMDFTADGFNIRDYIAKKRKTLEGQELIMDPVIHEFIRFQHIRNLTTLVEKNEAVKQAAVKIGRAIPALYGNQSRINGLRPAAVYTGAQSDIIWSEESSDTQPCFDSARQANSTSLYKIGRASAHFKKPVWTLQYQSAEASDYNSDNELPIAIANAEALANGGLTCQTWVASPYDFMMKSNYDDWEKHYKHVGMLSAKFADYNRVLFTDREGVAETAIVWSVTSTFWRYYMSLMVPTDHQRQYSAAARLLEENHVPYEALVLGHPDVFDDEPSLQRLGKYKQLIVPEADCVSDRQAKAIAQWVQDGGKLILWGEVGTRDEEMNIRSRPVFADLKSNSGKGSVEVVSEELIGEYVQGKLVVPTSKHKALKWRYSFDKPGDGWFKTNYDDSEWKTGEAPFGDVEVRGTMPNTLWKGTDIWIRREFTTDEEFVDPQFWLQRWWGAEIYINGVLAADIDGRGRIDDGYQQLDMMQQGKAAIRKGKNVISVHCRASRKHPTWERFIDVGIIDMSNSEALASMVTQDRPLLVTELPSMVWANLWKHGGGNMLSVQMINYQLDINNDEIKPVEDFMVKVRIPKGAKYSQAYLYNANYKNDHDKPAKLSVRKKGDYAEVKVPKIDVFGIVTFSEKGEIEAREAASFARKWFERIKMARRCRAKLKSDDTAFLNDAKKQLAGIQGNVKVENYNKLIKPLTKLGKKLETHLNELTQEIDAYQKETLYNTTYGYRSGVDAVYKLDFGEFTAASWGSPGWDNVTENSLYTPKGRAYGWLSIDDLTQVDRASPDLVHRDFIRNRDFGSYPVPKDESGEISAQHSRSDGLFFVKLDPGEYIVTVVSGDYYDHPVKLYPAGTGGPANIGRSAMTCVDANGELKLLGAPGVPGYFQNRAFRVTVKDKGLTLRFWSDAHGSLYHNPIQWLVNALIIQKEGSRMMPAAAEYLTESELINKAAIRDWMVLGPFDDHDCEGLSKSFGPENNDDLAVTYKGKDGKSIKWQRYSQATGQAPRVPLNKIYNDINEAAGFVQTNIYCPKAMDVFLLASASQYATGYVNGKKVFEDQISMGLLLNEERVPIKLKKGWNTIAIKTLNHWGREWAVWAGLLTTQGEPLAEQAGVVISAEGKQ